MKTTWLSFIFAGLLLALVSISDPINLLQPSHQPALANLKSNSDLNITGSVNPSDLTANLNHLLPAGQTDSSQSTSVSPKSFPNEPAPPLVEAASAAIYDLSNHRFVFTKSADQLRPLASLTKLMTAVISSENIGYDRLLTISPTAVATEEVAGYLEAGEVYSVRSLLEALLIVSSNDAATALAEFGDSDQFIKAMNQKADFLDMSDTVFMDPAGLNPNTHGTVSDLVKLAEYIYQEKPEIINLSRQYAVRITDREFSHSKDYVNIHPLAASPAYRGGKTGYLAEAQGNLLTFWQLHDQTFLFIVLGAPDRAQASQDLIDWLNRNYDFYYRN